MTSSIILPRIPTINVANLRKEAEERMEKGAFGYYASGATDEYTLIDNSQTFSRLQIINPVYSSSISSSANRAISSNTNTTITRSNNEHLPSTTPLSSSSNSPSKIDLSSSILGYPTSFPLGIAPCAFHKLADPDHGEISTAKGIQQSNISVCWSTFGTCSIYDVCKTIYVPTSSSAPSVTTTVPSSPPPPCFFQLYWLKDKKLTQSLINHAATAGCKAIVLTVDRPVLGKREIDLRAKFDLPPGMTCPNVMNGKINVPNYQHYWETLRAIPSEYRKPNDNTKNTMKKDAVETNFEGSFYLTAQVEDTLTWNNIQDLRTMIKNSCEDINNYYLTNYNSGSTNTIELAQPMAIILKGIMTYEDGYASVVYGSDAVWISNHGGRQLDTVLSCLDALPEVLAGVRAAEADIRSGNLVHLPYKGLSTKDTLSKDTNESLLPSGRLRTEVYVDGGISTGSDIFKCLALGADHVFLARPILWALAVGGETLVHKYIENLRNELRDIMDQCQLTKIEDITLDYLTDNYSNVLGQNKIM